LYKHTNEYFIVRLIVIFYTFAENEQALNMWKSDRKTRQSAGKVDKIVGTESNPTKMKSGQIIINKKATEENLDKLIQINEDGLDKSQTGKTTTDGTQGGLLKGKPHYDAKGNPTGGIPVVVDKSRNIEVEGEEFVVNAEASKKHWQELSKINQSAGNGVAIGPPNGAADEDPEEYDKGGKIQFNPNHVPNKWILSFAEKVRTKYPKVWDLGGNIFGNEAYKNLKRVAERGYWLDSEEWMYIKWQSYIARHKKDFRIAGVIAMLKWVDKVDRGWAYMKDLIEERIKKETAKPGWKHKMKGGGQIPTNDFIYYNDLNDDLEQKLYSTAQEYFVKHKTDDYWHFSMQYFNGNQVTFEIYSALGGYWLNFHLESNKPLLNTIKLVPIEKMKQGGTTQAQKEKIGKVMHELIKRADGTYSQRGLWDNIRANIGSGKKPTKQMLEQEEKIKRESKYHLGGDMSKHLAPNGKPSNLTHEQWHLVRTPEFKAWFGDWEHSPETASKVVDENGEPLVVWHGTNKEFNVFGKDKNANILPKYRKDYEFHKNTNYFHTDKNYAQTFGSRGSGNEKPYFLYVETLKLVDEDTIEDIGYVKTIYDYYVTIDNADGVYSESGQYATLLSPRQIKLADGSNTTFDSKNPDIRFEEGGLIAPNGKKSNLTPEQYKLVRTPQFKSWFGDWENNPKNSSQVVDENGEPLVVYRGDSSSSKKGNIFKTGFNRMGFISKERLPNQYFHYFVNQYDVALGYAKNQIEDHNDKVEYTGKGKMWETKVTPYFLNIRNPIDITPNNKLFPTFEQYKAAQKKTLGAEWYKNEEYRMAHDYGFYITASQLNKIYANQLGKDYLENDSRWSFLAPWYKEQFETDYQIQPTYHFFIEYKNTRFVGDILYRVYNKMVERKIDGLIFLESTHWNSEFWENHKKYQSGELKDDYRKWVEKPKVFAALESNQIKLADGTNTTFDSENPDIRFKGGGLINLNDFNKQIKLELKKSDYEHWETKEEKRKGITSLYANEYYSQNNIIPLAEPDDEYSLYFQRVSLNDKEYIIGFSLFFHDIKNPLKITEANVTFYDEDYNEISNPNIRYDDGGNTDYNELYEVYVYDHNEPVKVFSSYNLTEAKNVLNEQRKSGKKGAHIQYSFKDGGTTDARDTVTFDIPLLIRTLELAREDIKSDAELHRVVENLIELKNKKVLTMDDYDYIAYIKKHTEQMKQGGTTQAQKEKIAKVMHEFKSGELHSGSKRGPIVTNRDQAIAIALSEAGASKYAPGGGVDDWQNKGLKTYLESVGFAIRTDGIVKYESVEVVLWLQRKYEIKKGDAFMIEVGSPDEPYNSEDKGLKIAVIDNIFNNSVRGKGLASVVLDKIVEGADLTKTTLQLIPEQMDEAGLTTEQLIQWYSKRGFKPIGDGEVYQRTPEAVKEKTNSGNIEPIRTLGNGASVYFETDFYRLNERYLKPGYLLLVNKAGDQYGVPEWEFEFTDLNEAMYVANKLYESYPNGVSEAVLLDKYVDEIKKGRAIFIATELPKNTEAILQAIKPKAPDSYFNNQIAEVSVNQEIWNILNQKDSPFYFDGSGEERIKVRDDIFNAWLNVQRQKDSRFEPHWAIKIEKVLALDPEAFKNKFSLHSFSIDKYARLSIRFKNGDYAVMDLPTMAKLETTITPKLSIWDRYNDVKYFLDNAAIHIDSKPELVLANLKSSSKQWTGRPKGMSKAAVETKTEKANKPKFSEKLYRGVGDRVNVTYGKRTDEGLGDFWTNNRTMAEWFAGLTEYDVNTERYQPTGGNGKVLEQVIELQNPYVIDSSHPEYEIDNENDSWQILMDDMDAKTKDEVQEYVSKLVRQGYDGIVLKDNQTNYYESDTYDIVVKFTDEQMKNAGNEMPMNNTISTYVTDYANPYEVNRAIEKLIQMKGMDRNDYTPDEIKFISYFSGYGGLAKYGTFSDEELKGLLYEFFTPDEVVRKMWGLAYKYGYGTIADNSVLEPSVGVGAFLRYAPEDVPVVANEINPVSANICSILYPNAHIVLQPFEKNFIKSNLSIKSKIDDLQKYSLVIGNPPYGELKSKYIAMGEKDYTMAGNWIEYFITRGLDLLHPGGLLIYIVGTEQMNGGTLFLDSPISKVKRMIFDKAELVDAYRLPANIFERTGVSSEIIVFKKK